MNLQPWAFAVVTNRERIADYGRRAKEWLLADLSRNAFGEHARQMLQDPAFNIFYNAPALVLVLAKSSETQASEDACLAAQTLMLAARDRGLGTCWIGFARLWLNLPATKTELGLPAQYEVVAPLILGHPKAWPPSHGRNPAEIYWMK
jgi:nitroreductase